MQINSDTPEGWMLYGYVMAKLQQYEEAIASCIKATPIEPSKPITWYSMACCYGLQGNVELTVKNLQWAIDIDSSYKEQAITNSDFDNIRETAIFKQLIS
ncbi:tetratricopeptide repeat protein [Gloeocapsopsis dulcis]|uniref:Uncharacterized protein n=1 Tax=Gloeocapsopsis dulcis AAB1 = 1H9 TaxID=1433147 RepID=A0A6N8FPC5_9CHRO|nr:hypothetical protein [Gloeocapsopsis dulcis]MUL35160.1 hypothetical protein [Gloeocapsopsis dulcis AAB1 = 1H9]WNN89042.1 hypothetical protein P0S91_22770 [Gloeocapsopsis dulcis]